jgi:hypothetical protein
LRPIRAISTIERIKVGTYCFTWDHNPKSQASHGYLHGNIF